MFTNDQHNRLKSDAIPELFNYKPESSVEDHDHDDNVSNEDCLPSCSTPGMIFKLFILDWYCLALKMFGPRVVCHSSGS